MVKKVLKSKRKSKKTMPKRAIKKRVLKGYLLKQVKGSSYDIGDIHPVLRFLEEGLNTVYYNRGRAIYASQNLTVGRLIRSKIKNIRRIQKEAIDFSLEGEDTYYMEEEIDCMKRDIDYERLQVIHLLCYMGKMKLAKMVFNGF